MSKVPIGFAMALTAFLYFSINNIPMQTMVQKALSGPNESTMVAIPLFILAGELMNLGGISDRLLAVSNSLFRHIRGGTGLVTVMTCMIFGGATGNAGAEVSAIGPIVIPEMKRQGYKGEFAAAIIGVGSELGPIIPPSVPMVICAALARISAGKMLLSGVIPGIIIGCGLLAVVYIICCKRRYPNVLQPRASLKEVGKSLADGIWSLLAPLVLIGGLVVGIFTPVEAGAVAVGYAIFVGAIIYKKLKIKDAIKVCYSTALQTSTVMILVGFANLYIYILTREKISIFVADVLSGYLHSPQMVLLIVLSFSIPLGMLLSATPSMMLLVPVLVPLSTRMNMDPVYFFSIVTMSTLIGSLTPPVATTLYIVSSMAESKPESAFVEMIPLLAVIYGTLILATLIPGIVTWIPNLAYS
jgi:tripartite ATP-independent transporter DctM subunit